MLRQYVLKRENINQFLDPDARVWARFHPDYGYLLRNAFLRDGVHGAYTLGRYEPTGQRQQVNFRDQPCRINTYGDSFTQGHQVSDGETWQEVLAAHFCEPIRNFGIGGFGVYQAYRRLLEVEQGEQHAEFLVFNIWGDDHLRSVNAWRWLTFPEEVLSTMDRTMFHANPWSHARLDPDTGQLIHVPNPCPTPESLYNLCNEDAIVELFGADEVVHALAAIRYGEVADKNKLDALASACDFSGLDLSTQESVRRTTTHLYHAYAVRVGMLVMDEVARFAAGNGKRLFVLLSHPAGSVWHHCSGKLSKESGFIDWHPKTFQQHLSDAGIPYLDTVAKHVDEFQTFRGSAKEYVDRYFIGHYNPTGNHFFAHAVRSELVEWLSPAPPAYRGTDKETLIRFEGYLPG